MSDGEILLDATLRPSPPLPPRALLIILILVAAINLVFGLSFVLHGAWPIMPFLGADVALLAWAFRTARRNAAREEQVTLTRSMLRVAQRNARGAQNEIVLNPYWVRVDMEEPPQHGSQLTLLSHGKGVRIGAFLPPLERASFAQRLKSALRRARG